LNNCFTYLFQWLWKGQSGVILILTCDISGLLHAGYIVDSVDGGVYKDIVDSDQALSKKAMVDKDVKRAIKFKPYYQDIPVIEWVVDRQGRDIVWAHYHRGTKLSAAWTTLTMIIVTVLFWKKWSKGTWKEYFSLLIAGVPSFIKMAIDTFR